jgi:hypothetical protein
MDTSSVDTTSTPARMSTGLLDAAFPVIVVLVIAGILGGWKFSEGRPDRRRPDCGCKNQRPHRNIQPNIGGIGSSIHTLHLLF